jgi:hypothetical protein
MKYQPAAILLATAAASSDGLDATFENNPRPRLMPMYGYCIGCVALVSTTTHNIDNTEFTSAAITPSISSSTGKNVALSSNGSGSALDQGTTTSSCSEKRLFLPTPKKNTTSSSTTNNLLHQLNLILLSRSIHNNKGFGEQQQPFLSDIYALSLFLVAVAIGIAWGGSSTNDKKKKEEEYHDDTNSNEHEFDLVSRRLVYDEFFDINIGLVPTIDDDEDNEEEKYAQQQEQVEKEAINDTSVLSPLVGDIIKPQRTLTLPHHDHEQQEWKKPPLFHPTDDDEDETSTITTQEEAIIAGYRKYLPITRKNKAKEIVKKSILTIRSPSHTECVLAASTPKVTTKKRVSFHKDVRVKVIPPDDDEEASISSSSSTTKKKKGLFKLHKLSLGNLCEVKSREYVPMK